MNTENFEISLGFGKVGFVVFSNQSVWGLFVVNGDSGTTRTYDPLLRREMLYPAELRNHTKSIKQEHTISKVAGFVKIF